MPLPSPLLLDQDALGVEVQVPEEEAKDSSGAVESLAAQEEVKLTFWRKAFYRPHKYLLNIVRVSSSHLRQITRSG